MLQDETLEYIQQQFDEKDAALDGAGERVSVWTFYEDVFGDLDLEVPVVIIDDEEQKKIRTMTVDDAISFSACRNDVLLGGCTYFNNWISKKSARDVYTLIIDLDNVYSGTLITALQNDWKSANGEAFAKPTYIVNSGTGLHLYYVFNEPIPVYNASRQDLDKLYRNLAIQQSRRVYIKQQVQWFGQDFRMAGGRNKYDWENTIYKIGDKWDIDELSRNVGIETHFIRYGEPKKKKPSEQRKRVKRVGWKTDRAFYDCALRTCREKTKEGNRYMSMCALTVIAYKCGVAIEELERDLYALLPFYNKNSTNPIKEKEIASALKMYNEKAMETPRASLEHWQGWEYSPIKRNGRKQKVHLARARVLQEYDDPDGNWRNKDGRPKGSGTAEQKVKEWRKIHPAGTKADCHRETKLDPKTIRKWWD